MREFNLDHPAQKSIYSFGGSEHPNQTVESLKLTNFFIRNEYEQYTVTHNDGVFLPEETDFSHSMGAYQMDHSRLIGMGDSFPHFQMALDNTREVDKSLL